MKFLLDENFPLSVAGIVEDAGHEVLDFSSVCDFGANDEAVFAEAQKLGAVILTSDRDFYHTIPLLHPNHHGIIVVALRQPNRTAISTRLKWFLENVAGPFENRVFVLRDFTYRIR